MYLRLNECNENFLDKLNVANLHLPGSNISTTKDINHIVYKYGMFDETETKIVSIANIIGHNSFFSGNVFEQLDELFDNNGDSYHQRSVGMLDYDNDEIIEKLSRSFKSEPIEVNEIEENQSVISTNGLHRWTTLRCHYLAELQTTTNIEELNKKYEIPVRSEKCNYTKTYCNYFLNLIPGLSMTIRNQYDSNYKKTGNVELTLKEGKKILNDDELLLFTKSCLEVHGIEVNYEMAHRYYDTENLKSYQTFLKDNFPTYQKGVDNNDISNKNR